MPVRHLFATPFYSSELADPALLAELAHSCRILSKDDSAGRRWCRENRYPGYTSYASLDDLPRRDPSFAALARKLVRHAAQFAAAAHMDLGGGKPRLDSIWVNILKPGGGHSGHIHPHSVISGTLYLEVPEGGAPLRLEDPRLPLMMAAPTRLPEAPEEARPFVLMQPQAGHIFLWESWLRHEVVAGHGKGERLSISFNFA
ncbi:TIGR02466 family protein [Sandaracinobacter sp. RS1-74]|uniref:TIGR02466 family protein n=1 Tax=Sandaracinobacteroides sayramensis TaxID=2913411 RepID=UPI001EDA2E81|nr:TIGR02466 family protein [Sandaracinobacteroides sayramensis]MCG2840218.1 TIGR02466 family protein [Sandaracinobacteroides sayramensis]